MKIFTTDEPTLAHRNGKSVTVLETRTEPMQSDPDNTIYRVRFADGFEAIAFAEELVKPTAPEYRDTL